jgi:hypothetical protein
VRQPGHEQAELPGASLPAAARPGAPPQEQRYRSQESASAVDGDDLPSDPARPLRGEEPHPVGNVCGLAETACRDPGHQFPLPVGAITIPLGLRGRVGQDEAGGDAVNGDAERAQFVRHLPGEAQLARLGAGVGLDPGLADGQSRPRRDDDDPPPAAFPHAGHGRPCAQERRGQVGVDHRPPSVVGDLVERAADLADDPAGRVDQDVHRSDGGEEGGNGDRVGQVHGGHRRPVQAHGSLVDPVNLGPVRREGVRDRQPDPVGGPSNDRDPACQPHT